MSNEHDRTILTIGVVPIPVGHRVDVRFYSERKRYETRTESPVIVDLETGVVYGQHWHFGDINSATVGTPMHLPATVRAELQPTRRIVGRVTSAQVAWITINHPFPQTTLHVEPLPEPERPGT